MGNHKTINQKPSMTQQHFRNECDINFLYKKYRSTGVLGDPARALLAQKSFADVSQVPDLMEIHQKIIDAGHAFDRLKPEIRERFKGSIPNFLNFLQDPKNREEAIELGLISKPDKQKSGQDFDPEKEGQRLAKKQAKVYIKQEELFDSKTGLQSQELYDASGMRIIIEPSSVKTVKES